MEETLELLENALDELESAHETIKILFDELNEKYPQYRINKHLELIKHKENRILMTEKTLEHLKHSEDQDNELSYMIGFMSSEKQRLVKELEQAKEQLKLLQNN